MLYALPRSPRSTTRVADAFVAVDNPSSLIYWTQHFGISAELLREAAEAAGPTVHGIEGYLKGKGSSGRLKPKFRVASF